VLALRDSRAACSNDIVRTGTASSWPLCDSATWNERAGLPDKRTRLEAGSVQLRARARVPRALFWRGVKVSVGLNMASVLENDLHGGPDVRWQHLEMHAIDLNTLLSHSTVAPLNIGPMVE
jgi:hypothetical protein